MTHFNLVRYRNGDFVLSAGSRIPVDAAMASSGISEMGTHGGSSATIADLLIDAGNGMTVETA
ncbi:MAG: hypothetical protein K0Q70_58 [Rhodospirillales bacterium]|jgi:hypothetical protein|nr:hypothetical protein [Rhodospirillales bacterium]